MLARLGTLPVAVLLVLISIALVLASEARHNSRDRPNRRQEIADWVTREVVYVRDGRTGICFAYTERTQRGSFGPGLATVACDAIPTALLTVGAITK